MSRRVGAAFEKHAERYLQQQGLHVLERNVRYRYGEIDLIMRDAKGTLVFVEVRARSRPTRFGGAQASITATKKARIHRAAQGYLTRWPGPLPRCRFDVLAFEGSNIIWLVDVLHAQQYSI